MIIAVEIIAILCLTMFHFLAYILLYWSDYKIKILLLNSFWQIEENQVKILDMTLL